MKSVFSAVIHHNIHFILRCKKIVMNVQYDREKESESTLSRVALTLFVDFTCMHTSSSFVNPSAFILGFLAPSIGIFSGGEPRTAGQTSRDRGPGFYFSVFGPVSQRKTNTGLKR